MGSGFQGFLGFVVLGGKSEEEKKGAFVSRGLVVRAETLSDRD